MLILHQLSRVASHNREQFEQLHRDQWLPSVAQIGSCRFAWYAMATPLARRTDEVATITVIPQDDVDEFFAAVRSGSLAALASEISALRDSVETRLMRPIDYDPWARSGVEIPAEPVFGPTATYMHDFVPPCDGQMNAYSDMMRDKYMALTDADLSGVVLRMSWQTVAGGGPVPEMFNLSEVLDLDMLQALFVHDVPREQKAMGTWMWDALAVRDQWTTRLLRCAEWSPVK